MPNTRDWWNKGQAFRAQFSESSGKIVSFMKYNDMQIWARTDAEELRLYEELDTTVDVDEEETGCATRELPLDMRLELYEDGVAAAL